MSTHADPAPSLPLSADAADPGRRRADDLLRWLIPVGLLLATLAAYWPALRGDFIWDDDYYVVNNAALRSFDGIQDIWLGILSPYTYPAPQYYPMTFTSLWLDYRIWGLNPLGYHLTNVVLHVLCAWCVWGALRKLGVPGAALAAFIFALHPMNVESVAWITERKNVLSTLFFLAALLVYLRYCGLDVKPKREEAGEDVAPTITKPEARGVEVEARDDASADTIAAAAGEGAGDATVDAAAEAAADGAPAKEDYRLELPDEPWKLYALALLLFACALLSKTVTATLPAVVLVILWWKRGRVTSRDVLPLLPFFVLGLSMSVFTGWMERWVVGAVGADWDYTPVERVLIAGRAVWFYVLTLFAPFGLAFMYEKWAIDAGNVLQWLAPLAVIGTLAAAVALVGRVGRWPLATLLLFGGTLLPALGFVNFLPMRYAFVANHFAYLPAIALIAAACGAGAWLLRDRPAPLRVSLAAAVVLVLGVLTFRHAQIYRGPETLWRDTLARSPNSWMAYNNLGDLLRRQGRLEEAEPMFQRVMEMRQNHVEAPLNLGRIAEARGDAAAAERYYRQAIENAGANQRKDDAIAGRPVRRRVYAQPLMNLASLKVEAGDLPSAEALYRRALEQDAVSVAAMTGLGEVLRLQGKMKEALDLQIAANEIDPASPQVRINLGSALMSAGQLEDALLAWGSVLQEDPNNAQAANNIGLYFAAKGQWRDAINMFEMAVKAQPDFALAQRNLEAARRRAATQPATAPAGGGTTPPAPAEPPATRPR